MLGFEKDIYEVYKKGNPNYDFKKYGSLYLYTTENLKGYFPNTSGLDVLTVIGSGDHYLNAIFYGAKSVTLFDINIFAKYILNLKMALIKKLSYEDYLNFMGIDNLEHLLDYEKYSLVRDTLDENTRYFWDYLYDLANYRGYDLYFNTKLFYYFPEFKKNKECNPYLENESTYLSLKEKLTKRSKPVILDCNITELSSKLDSKYDMIFFSNIEDYFEYREYLKVMEKFYPLLKKDGVIYLAYLYNYSSNKIYLELLEKSSYIGINIPSVETEYNNDSNTIKLDKVIAYYKK